MSEGIKTRIKFSPNRVEGERGISKRSLPLVNSGRELLTLQSSHGEGVSIMSSKKPRRKAVTAGGPTARDEVFADQTKAVGAVKSAREIRRRHLAKQLLLMTVLGGRVSKGDMLIAGVGQPVQLEEEGQRAI